MKQINYSGSYSSDDFNLHYDREKNKSFDKTVKRKKGFLKVCAFLLEFAIYIFEFVFFKNIAISIVNGAAILFSTVASAVAVICGSVIGSALISATKTYLCSVLDEPLKKRVADLENELGKNYLEDVVSLEKALTLAALINQQKKLKLKREGYAIYTVIRGLSNTEKNEHTEEQLSKTQEKIFLLKEERKKILGTKQYLSELYLFNEEDLDQEIEKFQKILVQCQKK